MVIKILTITLKSLALLVMLIVLVLAIAGGGWGPKNRSLMHPFYSGDLTLVAHRGVADRAPENTIASATRAKDLGFQFIELDLKQSKDYKFYLFHDRDSKRLFETEIPLNDRNLSEIQEYPLFYHGAPTRHRVPDLIDFTKQFSPDLSFYLDIKRHGNYRYAELASKITNFLDLHQLSDKCLVGSDFLFTVFLEYQHPELHTVFTGPGDWTIVFYRWIPKAFRPDFIISYAEGVTDWHLQWLRKNDLMNRRMLYGVDGSNYLRVRQWGVPFLVVEYDPVMKDDLN